MKSPQNIEQLRALRVNGVHLNFRFFLEYQPAKNGYISNACLSQWWPCIFTVDGNAFSTAEHYMMYEKAVLFGDRITAARIIETDHPFEAKTLGRLVRGFDEQRWSEARLEIVMRGNLAKFSQNPKLLSFLMNTGDAVLAEASPTDLLWGIGCREESPIAAQPENWPGQNLLGFALMHVRDHLSRFTHTKMKWMQ